MVLSNQPGLVLPPDPACKSANASSIGAGSAIFVAVGAKSDLASSSSSTALFFTSVDESTSVCTSRMFNDNETVSLRFWASAFSLGTVASSTTDDDDDEPLLTSNAVCLVVEFIETGGGGDVLVVVGAFGDGALMRALLVAGGCSSRPLSALFCVGG